MTPRLDRDAPGKLMLFGAYAVLAGAPALAVPVDRCARARLCNEGEALEPASAGGALVRAAWSCFAEHAGRERPAVVLDCTELHCEGRKLGLGSSSAALVCLVELFADHLQLPKPSFERLLRAHQSLQEGRGSGVDVAVAFFRRPVALRWVEGQLRLLPSANLRLLPWRAFSLGASLSTATALHRFDLVSNAATQKYGLGASRSGRDNGENCTQIDKKYGLGASRSGRDDGENDTQIDKNSTFFAVLGHLVLLNEGLWAAARVGDQRAQFALLRLLEPALQRLGEKLELDIVCGRHRALSALARQHGLVAVPSGAGGGELCLVFGEPEALRQFSREAERPGVLPVGCSPLGDCGSGFRPRRHRSALG